MGVVYELVVNFGGDREAMTRAHAIVRATDVIIAAGSEWRLDTTPTTAPIAAMEFTVWPHGMGATDGFIDPSQTPGALAQVANQLYDLLRRFDHYLAAQVGWNPECDVDLDFLYNDYVLDGGLDHLSGLVLAQSYKDEWNLVAGWEEFAPGYIWRPHDVS